MTVWTRERPPVRVSCAVYENRLNSANLGLDPLTAAAPENRDERGREAGGRARSGREGA